MAKDLSNPIPSPFSPSNPSYTPKRMIRIVGMVRKIGMVRRIDAERGKEKGEIMIKAHVSVQSTLVLDRVEHSGRRSVFVWEMEGLKQGRGGLHSWWEGGVGVNERVGERGGPCWGYWSFTYVVVRVVMKMGVQLKMASHMAYKSCWIGGGAKASLMIVCKMFFISAFMSIITATTGYKKSALTLWWPFQL